MIKLVSARYFAREDADHDLWLQRQFWGEQIAVIKVVSGRKDFRIETLLYS